MAQSSQDTPANLPTKPLKYSLPAYRNLVSKERYAIRRIDSAMGQAGRLPANDPMRRALLESTLLAIDSALTGTDNPYFLVNKGDVLLMLGKPIAAEGYYRQAMAQLPGVAPLRRNHAKACADGAYEALALGDSDQAIRLLHRYALADDSNRQAINLLVDWSLRRGVGLLRAHKDDLGKRTLRRAYAWQPNHYMVQLNLGIAHYRMQGFDSAIFYFARCAQSNANDRAPANYLNMIYTRMGKPKEAAKYAPPGLDGQ
jgi:predicted Zn-dependent protease